MPRLSFIVPVYKVEEYLPRCLDSILAQSFSDWEIVAVDDESPDSCGEILARFEQNDPRIRVFHKKNGGLSDARNFGLERALGEYIAFVDSDDFLHPRFAEKTVEKMEAEGLDLLLCDYFYAYDSGENVPVSSRRFSCDTVKKEVLLAPPMAWLRVYRRSLLEKDPFVKGIYYEDLEMTPGLVLRAETAGFLEEPLYYYYQREGSIMGQKTFSPKFLDIFAVTDSVYKRFADAGQLDQYREEIEFLFLEHLFRSAALRFAPLPEGKDLFFRLRAQVEEKFPHWKKNRYLAHVSLFFRLTVSCTGKGWLWAVKILARLKG